MLSLKRKALSHGTQLLVKNLSKMANHSFPSELFILCQQICTNWQVGDGSYQAGVASTHLRGPFTSLVPLISSDGVRAPLFIFLSDIREVT